MPEYAQGYDPGVERRLVRKIDLILISFMWIGYGGIPCLAKVESSGSCHTSGLVYYDKAILGGATVFGLSTDLHLKVVVNPHATPPTYSAARLSWATSMFYFGMVYTVLSPELTWSLTDRSLACRSVPTDLLVPALSSG